jgi:hypothetical protein
MDVSKYILLSVYKRYIHLELLPNRTATSLIIAYNNVHTWFAHIGHYIQFQITKPPKDYNCTSGPAESNTSAFPYNKRANKAEWAIQTFKVTS